MDCLRYFGITSFEEIDRMTVAEHIIRLKAYQLKEVDRLHNLHQQAWANNMAGATKKNGKPHYKRFKQFFNYEKAISKIMGTARETPTDKLRDLVAKHNRRKGG